ncbi:MAG TPA: MarR family transcriptional regulator [Micromonosporaceae bacterium]|jgi:DNA-binding MarR family transcriptional regulator
MSSEQILGRAADDRASSVAAAHAVRGAVVRLARKLQSQRQEHGVSATGIALLARLYRGGMATPKALAEAEGAQPQTLTRVIASLEEQHLINRRPDPADGRGVLLDITGEGLLLLRDHAATQTKWLIEAMDAELTSVERDLLRVAAELLDRLADHR